MSRMKPETAERLAAERFPEMSNRAMARKLASGECIDISASERTPDGDYILTRFIDGKDYCDAVREEWVWSIGRRLIDSVIIASVSGYLYQNGAYECLWLR